MTEQDAYIQANESFRPKAYLDTGSVPTIGWGHTGPEVHLGLVWTQDQADLKFASDAAAANSNAALDLGQKAWGLLDPVRQIILTDMAYELGPHGLAGFVSMLAAIRLSNWQEAHDQCLNSRYAREVPGRAGRSARGLLTGILEFPS